MKNLGLWTSVFLGIGVMANANILTQFDEGAPKDRFTFTNQSACSMDNVELLLDLSTSLAGLVFDIQAGGSGVEVFQPLEFVVGSNLLSAMPTVEDGANSVVLDIASLPSGAAISFTIDIDDTLGGREITVNGSEISGASVTLIRADRPVTATFSSAAKAEIEITDC